MSMGRPSTPGPENGGGDGGKQTFPMLVILAGIVSTVLGIIVVAVPYWGYYQPQGAYSSTIARGGAGGYYGQNYIEGGGYFGPFLLCKYTGPYGSSCSENILNYRKEVYMTIAGICAIVSVIASGIFTISAGLHCAMRINNKKIFLKYKTNAFVGLIVAVLAVLGNVGAVILAAFQFRNNRQAYVASMGWCYYLEILLIFVNFGLSVVAGLTHKRVKRSHFPKHRNPYEITGDRYEPEHGRASSAGVTVTQNSGQPYKTPQPPPYSISSLPPYPAPAAAATAPANQYRQQPAGQMGYYNEANTANGNGYNHNSLQQNSYIGGLVRGQMAEPQARPQVQMGGAGVAGGRPMVPQRDEMVMGVSLNPVGRTAAFNNLKGGTGVGSMESLDSTKSSTLSFGSTGSAASINAPLRSSMKKSKNKEITSVSSNVSKKSVTIAIGAEQTAV